MKPKQLHGLLPISDSLSSLLSSEETDRYELNTKSVELTEASESCQIIQGIWSHLRHEELPSPSESYDIVEQVLEISELNDGSGDGVHIVSLLKDASINLDEGVEVDEMRDVMSPKKKNNAVSVAPQHSRLLTENEGARSEKKENGDGDGKSLEEDYLFIAGHHLARATDKELAGDYEVISHLK